MSREVHVRFWESARVRFPRAIHLPLYRQHQRLLDAGFDISRQWLTQRVQQGSRLLEPIFDAQLQSICSGHVITMDEVRVKAGQAGNGKKKATYFWPVYGDQDEVCFPHFESRRHEHVEQALGAKLAPGTVLLSDGYGAYVAYAKKIGITNAQCWAHARRGIFEAKDAQPQAAGQALAQIAAPYKIEDHIREHKLKGETKRLQRITHSKPRVDEFFDWVDQQFEQLGLLPSHPLTQALAYVRQRRAGLSVFLDDPEVAIDANHIERALCPIPTGRKNWLFCWTEVGAKHVGVVQSLIAT
jgi:transposase